MKKVFYKRVIIVVIVIVSFAMYVVFSGNDDDKGCVAIDNSEKVDKQGIVLTVVDYLKRREVDSVAKMVSYPLSRKYPLKDIRTKEEFAKYYKELFDKTITDSLVKNPNEWRKDVWRGIVFGNGAIWLDENGKITAINYETALSKKRFKEAITAEYNTLHSTIKSKAKEPILTFKTKDGKWIGRIDGIGEDTTNGDVQLALYKSTTSLAGKPDYLLKGKREIQGNIGGVSYYFQGSDTSFVLAESGEVVDENYPLNLFIKNGKCVISDVSDFDSTLPTKKIYWVELF